MHTESQSAVCPCGRSGGIAMPIRIVRQMAAFCTHLYPCHLYYRQGLSGIHPVRRTTLPKLQYLHMRPSVASSWFQGTGVISLDYPVTSYMS